MEITFSPGNGKAFKCRRRRMKVLYNSILEPELFVYMGIPER